MVIGIFFYFVFFPAGISATLRACSHSPTNSMTMFCLRVYERHLFLQFSLLPLHTKSTLLDHSATCPRGFCVLSPTYHFYFSFAKHMCKFRSIFPTAPSRCCRCRCNLYALGWFCYTWLSVICLRVVYDFPISLTLLKVPVSRCPCSTTSRSRLPQSRSNTHLPTHPPTHTHTHTRTHKRERARAFPCTNQNHLFALRVHRQ